MVKPDTLLSDSKGLMPTLDTSDIKTLGRILRAVKQNMDTGDSRVTAIKLGLVPIINPGLVFMTGLMKALEMDDVDIVVDFQKLGNDVEAILKLLVQLMDIDQVKAIITFPFAGMPALRAVVDECRGIDKVPILGTELTVDGFYVSQGGMIADGACEVFLANAITELGLRNFVFPGNKPARAKVYNGVCANLIGAGKYCAISPGFGKDFQRGNVEIIDEILGPVPWQAVLGKEISTQDSVKNMVAVLQKYGQLL